MEVSASAVTDASTPTAQTQVDQVQLSANARHAYVSDQVSADPLPTQITEQTADTALQNSASTSPTSVAEGQYTAYQQPAVTSGADNNTGQESTATSMDSVSLSPEAQQQLLELAQRDREVQIHEAAHAAVGGQYTGAPKLSYTTGPDGQRYATSGEVNVDLSEVPGDPAATIKKAEIIHAAALAPAQPSAQDRNVAAKAMQMKSTAQAELMAETAAASAEILADSTITSASEGSAQTATEEVIFSGAVA
jgi:hypothetical protein